MCREDVSTLQHPQNGYPILSFKLNIGVHKINFLFRFCLNVSCLSIHIEEGKT